MVYLRDSRPNLLQTFVKQLGSTPSMFKSRDTGKFRKALPCVNLTKKDNPDML